MKRFLRIPYILALIVLLFFLWHVGMRIPLEFVVHFGFGWLIFLRRVVPEITVRWSGVATALVALVLFVVGFHRLTTWFATPRAGEASGDPPLPAPPVWPWRWTILATTLVVLMFVSGISVVGMAHQVAWIVTSREAMTENNFIEFRRASVRSEARNRLKTLGLALEQYADEHERFPAGGTFTPHGEPMHSWQTALLPYIEQHALYEQIDQSVPWDDSRNRSAMETLVPEYMNPAVLLENGETAAGPAISHYAGNGWVLGGRRALRRDSVSDGLSNTLFSGEVNSEFKPWGHPLNWRDPMLGINRVPDGFGSPFRSGAHFLLGDGSVRFISDSVEPTVLKALSTPNGGETVGDY